MVIGINVTKPLAEKCWSLCTLVGKSIHAKVMAAFFYKRQPDIPIQLAYI